MKSLFASQPVYNRQLEIVGAELLYRSDDGLTAFDVGEDAATSEVLFNVCAGISDEVEHTNIPLYLNVSASFLRSGAFLPVKPEQVVIELTERIEPDAITIRAVEHWRDKGFTFALDDFEFKPSWDPLLRLASIIKVDVTQSSLTSVSQNREKLSRYPFTWLAEKVETSADMDNFKALGFDYFQGYFLSRPLITTGKKLPTAGLHLAVLLQKLFQAEPDLSEVASAISNEPTLSVSLLKIANSSLYRGYKEVNSVKDVIIRLGLETVKRWVTLISSMQCSRPANVHIALTRAYTCAEMVRHYRIKNIKPEHAFFTALLSASDILLGVDKKQFVSAVNVGDKVAQATLNYQGDLGKLVKAAELTERSIFNRTRQPPKDTWLRIYHQQSVQVQQLLNYS